MTHNFKTGVTYKTQNGACVTYIGDSVAYKHEDIIICEYLGDPVSISAKDIIGIWEDEPDEIDVANMWVCIVRHKTNGSIVAQRRMYADKPSPMSADTIAIIRVSEWEAIKRGERKLIKGEGL